MNNKSKSGLDCFKKLIIATVIGVIIIAGCIFNNQRSKIKQLEYELNVKQESRIREFDYSETYAIADSIKEHLNDELEYKVLDGNINIKHKYVFKDESILGFHKKETISGTATCYYEFIVPLKDAKVTINNDKITVVVPEVRLNEEATHRKAGTFRAIKDECSRNILMNRANSQLAWKLWEDDFDECSNDKIRSLYNQNELNETGRTGVEKLLKKLGYKNVDVKVEVK